MASQLNKSSFLLPLAIGLIVGFLAGAVFAVFKLDSSPAPPSAVQSSGGQQQSPGPSAQEAEAIANLKAAVAAKPDDADSWTRLGHLYYDSSQFQEAIDAYKRTLELQPSNSDVWTDMGVMYRRLNNPEEAIRSFDKAMSFSPNHLPSRLNKGVVLLFDLGKAEEAITSWEEALTINPQATTANGQSLREFVDQVKAEQSKKQ
ncbi:MAG: tetratricopeptide repeat protein [Thermodesulfobacteriota bacterium]